MGLPKPTLADPAHLLRGVTDLADALDRGELARAQSAASADDAGTLDGLDSLAFLRLAVAASRKVAFGTGTLTWGGVTAKSNVLTITHGLGATPTIVVATQAGGTAPAFFVIFVWGNAGGTTFDIAGAPPSGIPTNGQTATFSWIALA